MIFLSYSQLDASLITPIAEALAKVFGQEKVFFDKWSIQPGDSIIGKMNQGLASCKFFFYFVSKNSLKSKMAALEWQNALIKSVRKDVQFIPVKIDDCLIPDVLIQKLYINLYGYGLEVAIRQMIEVASNKNTYLPGQMDGFQNIRAYVSGTNRNMTIEFRAEAYTEPHSKYLILIKNKETEVSCSAKNNIIFFHGFQTGVLGNGNKYNAISISRSEATSPGFPFVVELSAEKENVVVFIGAMRADSNDSFISIPVIFLNKITG